MSNQLLISEGKLNSEFFDVSTYIQTDDGVGVYPAYTDASTVVTYSGTATANFEFTDITAVNSTGSTINYDLYIKADISFSGSNPQEFQIKDFATNQVLYNIPYTGAKEYFITVSLQNTNRLILQPGNAANMIGNVYSFTDIAIVPKGYPKRQSWAGSQLTAPVPTGTKSMSFSINNFIKQVDYQTLILGDSFSNRRFLFAAQQNNTTMAVVVYKDETATVSQKYTFTHNDNSIVTISYSSSLIYVYLNGSLLGSTPHTLTNILDRIRTETYQGFNLSQLITSTEESTGYPAGTTIGVGQPTVKLGVLNSEIDLPQPSRIISSMRRDIKKIEIESANATPNTQYIATKRRLNITYDVISEDNKKIITDIEDLQYTQNTRLNYIWNLQNGTLQNFKCRLNIVSDGSRVLRDVYYEGSLTLEIIEC